MPNLNLVLVTQEITAKSNQGAGMQEPKGNTLLVLSGPAGVRKKKTGTGDDRVIGNAVNMGHQAGPSR